MDINGISKSMAKLSTGYKINSAADNAAGLAITEKMNAQIKASNQNVDNMEDMSNLLSTAEGSLDSIGDSLGRMRELALQASNGIMSTSDKKIIQDEINALKQGISTSVRQTEFNTKKLLDGSFVNMHTAMNPDGSGKSISIENTSLETLGIKDFDVTGSFDIGDIDKAIEKVTASRSKIGSAQNAFTHAVNNSHNRVMNETSSMSSIKDTDMAAEITKLKKNQILQQYSFMMQKQKNDIEANKFGAVFKA